MWSILGRKKVEKSKYLNAIVWEACSVLLLRRLLASFSVLSVPVPAKKKKKGKKEKAETCPASAGARLLGGEGPIAGGCAGGRFPPVGLLCSLASKDNPESAVTAGRSWSCSVTRALTLTLAMTWGSRGVVVVCFRLERRGRVGERFVGGYVFSGETGGVRDGRERTGNHLRSLRAHICRIN